MAPSTDPARWCTPLWIGLLALVVAASGCNCGRPCGTRGECPTGERCMAGVCEPGTEEVAPDGGLDGGVADAGPGDGGAGPGDAGTVDAGTVDGGPMDAGSADAGAFDGGVDAGSCPATEQTCDDGLDNDCDGAPDCLDGDCLDRECTCPGNGCPASAWTGCGDSGDAGVCRGTQTRMAPACRAERTCGLRAQLRACDLDGGTCQPTAWSACTRAASTDCQGTQTRSVGTCLAGSCGPPSVQTRACLMPAGLSCGPDVCCGPGQAGYGRCGGLCASALLIQSCDGAGTCAAAGCRRVVCWGTGCGTGGEVSSVPCPL